MANRPQVPGWKNINSNKPEEYSSEFTVDGIRYANVTNVSTGQRQLYLVSGIGGTPITQRSLLVTTNSNGSTTNGEAYNSYINIYGNGKLQNALINNKKQSIFIIEKTSTSAEKTSLSETSEYKGSLANTEKVDPNQPGAPGGSTPTEANPQQPQQPVSGNFKYPEYMDPEIQDTILFTAVEYIPPGLGETGSVAGQRQNPKRSTKGTVTLPIQSQISDGNVTQWEGSGINEIARMALDTSFKSITGELNQDKLDVDIKKTIGKFSDPSVRNLALSFLGEQVLQTPLQGRFGGILNPNIELLFTGPGLREFSFNIKMSPRSEKESTEVKSIIRFFKENMAPKIQNGNLFLKSPNTFLIKYQGRGENGLNKIKECALTGCGVNYTPQGSYMTYEDGTMISYFMQLSFKEIEPIYDVDYKGLPANSIGY